MRKIKFYRLETGKCPVEEFFDSLPNKQFEKIAFVLDLIEQIDIVARKYFKKHKGTDDIWEVRVQRGNNIFRILGFFDGKDLVILNHAFTKKSQKIQQKDIAVAEKRKCNYFKQKDLKLAIFKNIRKNA
jgi:phage-related protein